MVSALLPLGLNRAGATLVFALSIYMVAVHTLLTALAAARSQVSQRTRVLVPFLVGAFLATWLATAVVVGDGTNFARGGALSRPLALAVGFGPVVFSIALLFRSRTMQTINAALPSEWLIRAQTYRVAGIMFLFPFLYYGVIPAGFAIPAAVGDFLTGAAAPYVAAQVAGRRPGALTLARAWNLFGIADLIVAPIAAVFSQAPVLQVYPLVLVPLFLGPPLGILTHIRSLTNLATASRATRADPPGSSRKELSTI